VLEKAYPVIDFNTPVEKITNLISRETGAVLAKDESGSFHILTKYDILHSLTH
jgi:cystathionine beta-synthase